MGPHPQVRVEFEPIESKRVSITGAVRTPGELKFAGELRVFDALVKAGMTTPDAATKCSWCAWPAQRR